MEKLLLDLKNSLIKYLSKDNDLDKPYLISGNKKYTKQDVINEINNETIFGNDMVISLVTLTLDLFNRGIKDIDNIEKI